jgi:uncharacterized protein (TIGR03437 family)
MRVLLAILVLPVLLAAGQYRAFWADAFHYGYKTPAEIDQMVEDLAQARANAVFMEVRHRGSSYYLRSLEPPVNWEREYSPGFDALDYLIQKAHARGIEVHAWFPVTSIWGGAAPPSDPRHAYLAHGPNASGDEMWMTVSAANTVSSFYVDPGHPAVLRYLADVIVHVAQNYDVDGLHLDYIRYPETADFGYNPTALERFQRLFQRVGETLPNDPALGDFRREQVTQLVRQVYLRALAVKPQLKVSAALITWGDGPRSDAEFRSKDAYRRVFQDWRAWLEEGILDLGIPMNYFREAANAAFFDRWNEYEKDRQYRRGALVGTAVYLNTIPDSVKQAGRALAPSAAGNRPLGVNFYSYASTNTLNAAGAPLLPNAEFYRTIGEFFGTPDTPPELEWKARPALGHVMGRLEVGGGPYWLADGATVRLVHEPAGTETITTTDSGGFFGFLDRLPGLYHARVERAGQTLYRTIQREVRPGQVTVFEARLRAEDFGAVLPRFAAEGVANAASFRGGPHSPQALLSLFGRNLAPRAAAAAESPLPRELGGVQVLVAGRPAPLLYVSPGQINFQAPSLPEGSYQILLRHSGLESEARSLTIGRSIGIFGVYHAASFQAVTGSSPARAGEYLAVFATGLGLTTPRVEDGRPGASEEPLHRTAAGTLVTLGNRLLAASFSGLAPGLVGVAQVNFQVPAEFPAGRARLVVTAGGTPSPAVEIEVR